MGSFGPVGVVATLFALVAGGCTGPGVRPAAGPTALGTGGPEQVAEGPGSPGLAGPGERDPVRDPAVRRTTMPDGNGVPHTVEVTYHGCSPETSLVVDGCRLTNLACEDDHHWGLIGQTYGELYDSPETVAAEAVATGGAFAGPCAPSARQAE